MMKELLHNPAFLYGESVFTTCLVKNGQVLYWQEHLNQLIDNALEYYFLKPDDRCVLQQKVLDLLQLSPLQDGALRISLYSSSRDSLFRDFHVRDLEVSVSFRQVAQEKQFLRLKLFVRKQDIALDRLKVASYGKEFYLKRLAMREGFHDVLFHDGEKIYEASTSNIFFIKENRIITPRAGVYKGIMREKVLEYQAVEQRDVYLNELQHFDSVFLTNSISGISSVVQIDEFFFNEMNFDIIF